MVRTPRSHFAIPAVAALLLLGAVRPAAGQQGPGQDFPDLVSGLLAVEGCLGVETAQTPNGKQVIFAWFENKAAVLRWYHSEMHRGIQDLFIPNRPPHVPLEGVLDDVGPIMVIASITMADQPHFEGTSLPISQIAIELYQPLPGGIFLGGRFAPASVEVPGMKDYTPRKP